MTRRWDGWSATAVSSGLACAVLYVGAGLTVVGLPDTGAAGGEVARYVHDHRTLLLGGTYLWGLAITANIVFATAVWGVLGRADGPAAANLAGLFGALALTVLEFGAFVVLATLAFRDALEAAMARTLADIFAITLDYTGFPSALWTGGASITMLAGRRYRPWLAWLGAATAAGWRDARGGSMAPLHRFLWIWCLFVIVFFSLSGTKLPHYALYGCTPVFVLIAASRERVTVAWLAAVPVLLLFAFVIALPNGFMHAAVAGWIKDGYYRAAALRAEIALPDFYRPVAWALLLLALVPLARPWRLGTFGATPADRVLAAAIVATIALCTIAAPYVGEVLQGPVKRAALAARAWPESAVTWNFHMPSFAVYRRRVTPIGTPQPGELALTRIDRLPKDADVDMLFQEDGVALVKRRR